MDEITAKLYSFGLPSGADGNKDMTTLLGGKGANLAEMAILGLPVPPGFTIPTSVCLAYQKAEDKEFFVDQMIDPVLEEITTLRDHFGYVPLLSVRSGAPVSMPGMMDTILNVGLTKASIPFWKNKLGIRPVLDSTRRLLQMYGETAMGVEHKVFEDLITFEKDFHEVSEDKNLPIDALKSLITNFKTRIHEKAYKEFPDTLEAQLHGSITAVFDSWNSDRAKEYRKIHGIPHNLGTAITIQSMVFGNMNDESCSGVLFTRDPSTGENKIVGEYLPNAQGEDVVAGIRTPESLDTMGDFNSTVLGDLEDIAMLVEEHYADMQDMEFTVQDGELFLLQTRNGKRSAKAAFKIAVDLVGEDVIDEKEAIKRVTANQYQIMMRPKIDPEFTMKPHGKAIPASGGIVSGKAVFSSQAAVDSTEPCILITKETTPNDIAGMNAAVGILTATGGLTSHAAVVARGMDTTCIVGCTELKVEEFTAELKMGKSTGIIEEGQLIALNGDTGEFWFNTLVPVVKEEKNDYAEAILEWARKKSKHLSRVMITPEALDLPAGKYYFDTVGIETDKLGMEFLDLLLYLDVHPEIEAVLDLTTNHHYRDNADDILWNAFAPAPTEKHELYTKITSLLDHACVGNIQARVHIVLPLGSEAGFSKELTKSGWQVVQSVQSIAELLDATVFVNFTDDFYKSVGGKAKANKLLSIFKKAGQKLATLPPAITKSREVFELLG